jgi:apolipoprotein D and lipocalin family protein
MSLALIVLLIAGAGAAGGASQGAQPVATVESIDLNRYVGEWHEIARFPNRFQRHCVGDVRATYTLRSDGRLDVVNQCRTADGSTSTARGVARVVDTRSRAKLKVRFAPAVLSWLPFVWGDYWVIGLADDYGWAVVGSPNREYLWILARTPALDDAQYEQALSRARANGFDVSRLERPIARDNGAGWRPRDRREEGASIGARRTTLSKERPDAQPRYGRGVEPDHPGGRPVLQR